MVLFYLGQHDSFSCCTPTPPALFRFVLLCNLLIIFNNSLFKSQGRLFLLGDNLYQLIVLLVHLFHWTNVYGFSALPHPEIEILINDLINKARYLGHFCGVNLESVIKWWNLCMSILS